MATEFNAQNATSAQASLIFSRNASDSPILPQPYNTISPIYFDKYCVPPTITGTWGTTSTFKVMKNGTTALWPTLALELGAITPPGGSVASWTQFIGFEVIDTIVCRFDSNELQTITGHRLRLEHEAFLRTDKNYAETVLVYGNRTNTQLYNDALGVVELRVPLLALFWGKELSKGFPTKHFEHVMEVEVTFKSLPQVVNL